MPGRWQELPIRSKLFSNVDPVTQQTTLTGQENCYITEAGGHSRFPGLRKIIDIPGEDPVYLKKYRKTLLAVTGKGRVYRISANGNAEDVTSVPVSGGKRPVFAETDDGLLMVAGGPIIRFSGKETEILSKDAPNSTHVGYIDSYVTAIENFSGRFYHADAGVIDKWNPLSVFTADGRPDDLHALFVTPFRELLLIGPESIEQFERLQSGKTPFFRRWSVGEGVSAPYTLCFADNATWGINQDKEFTRYSGQTAAAGSGDIQQDLHYIDDWTDAWAERLNTEGQTFIILQAPYASNVYGTKGQTFLFDVRQRRWAMLFGWDQDESLPARWPGWSYAYCWDRGLVGGNGCIYELDRTVHSNDGQIQRVLGRTAHMAQQEIRVDNLRMRLRRGVGSVETSPSIMIRCNRDNKGFGRWKRKGLGKQGDNNLVIEFGGYGCGHSFQFEWMITDECQVEIQKLEWQATAIGE